MSATTRAFLRASVLWLALGTTLGAAMAAAPRLVVYRPVHLHMNLLGFVAMMIFGVGYHVIPRFAGHPLRSERLAAVHWWLANLGLGTFAAGLALLPHAPQVGRLAAAIGGICSALGAYAFAWNIWRTLDGPATLRRVFTAADAAPPGRRPPVLEH
jgi:cbb3-type cytochrome oxidase subunit 1